ncbi:hypothetical protein QFZ51_000944 [Chitinophaga sp. W3I9]
MNVVFLRSIVASIFKMRIIFEAAARVDKEGFIHIP